MDNPQEFWGRRRSIVREDTVERANVKLVYDEDGIIKGFITGRDAHIWELFVAHPHQRSGIGSRLLKQLRDVRSRLHVNVYMLNHQAIKFYVKNDFVVTKLYTEETTGFTKFLMEWKKEQQMR
jgi:putative acetyltransferase